MRSSWVRIGVMVCVFCAAITLISVKEIAARAGDEPASAQASESKGECGLTASNLHNNRGLWGDKKSLREMMDDGEWGRYVDFVLAKNYTPACTMQILRAAVEAHEQGPLPLVLITTYTEFVLQQKK